MPLKRWMNSMARPAPDQKEAHRRGQELGELIDALGGLAAAAQMLRDDNVPGAGSLKRFRRGDGLAPDDLISAMRTKLESRPRWLRARDEKGRHWLVHNHAPSFSARYEKGEIVELTWYGDQPPPRVHGDLLAAARDYLAS